MDYSCTTRMAEGRVTLVVGGDVDLATHRQLLAAAEPWTAQAAEVVLDCAGVTFLDSMGLQALIRLRKSALAAGHEFVLLAPSRPVVRLLALSGLARHFRQIPARPEPAAAAGAAGPPFPGTGSGRHRGAGSVDGRLN